MGHFVHYYYIDFIWVENYLPRNHKPAFVHTISTYSHFHNAEKLMNPTPINHEFMLVGGGHALRNHLGYLYLKKKWNIITIYMIRE